MIEYSMFQDPVYTTSQGEIIDIGDPEWLGQFSTAVASLQSMQYTAGAADQYYSQYGYSDNQG